MSYHTIQVERRGAACVVRLNRPDKLNAISLEMAAEIERALGEAAETAAVSAVVVTGSDRAFSTGADLNDAVALQGAAGMHEFLRRHKAFHAKIELLAKPVLAAIEGYCLTGGLELAMVCDCRIGGEGSQYGVTSSKIGSVAGWGGTQRLPRLVGLAKAKELLFLAEFVDAAEAHRIGLINRLVPRGQALDEAVRWCEVMAQRAPLSLKLLKTAAQQGMQMDLTSALEFETGLTTAIYMTADREEGMRAFFEKRKPVFKGA
jgi:enoyl-CoA hydratase/carnithine racemase